MTDWLKNPLSLFDVRGKVAVVTGASGAFGALAAKVLAGAGAKLFISTGNSKELEKVAAECKALGSDVESLAIRTTNEANCGKIIDAAVTQVAEERGQLGSFQKNFLESNVRSLNVANENLSATQSQVRDTDFATETANYSRLQILQQSGMSVLAQANKQPQSVLALLQNLG